VSQGSSFQSPRGRGWALTGLTDSMWGVAFGPGGRRLASRSGDNTIIPWDVSLEFWQARACRIANRNLTEAEWNKFIGPDDLPNSIKQEQSREAQRYKQMSLKEALAEPEKNIIRHALEANGWNRQATAKALAINRTTLFKKMKQYGLYAEAERLGLT